MGFEGLQKRYDDFYVPSFEVKLGGVTIREHHGMISDLTVDTTLNGADRFSFTLNDVFDREKKAFTGLGWRDIKIGTTVEIAMGYGDERTPMLVGSVKSANPDFPAGAGPTIAVSGYDRLHEMMKGTDSRTWETGKKGEDRVRDSEIVPDVVTEYGLKTNGQTVDETKVEYRRITREKQSGYDFLADRATTYNFEIFARLDEVYFRAPKDNETPEITLEYGDSLSSFSLDLNESSGVDQVEVRGTDRRGKKEIVGRSEKRADLGAEKKVVKRAVESKEEATVSANAELSRMLEKRVEGSGETVGLPEIRAGDTVGLGGLGDPVFNETYYVTSASHRIGSSGYTTSFQARIPNEVKIE